jgi:hypothetical protein
MSIEKRILRGHRRATILLLFAVTAGTIATVLFLAQAILISEVVDRVFLLRSNAEPCFTTAPDHPIAPTDPRHSYMARRTAGPEQRQRRKV